MSETKYAGECEHEDECECDVTRATKPISNKETQTVWIYEPKNARGNWSTFKLDEINGVKFNESAKRMIDKEAYDALQSKVSELEKENERLRSYTVTGYELVVQELKVALQSARKVIQFYADENNWYSLDDSGVKNFGPWKWHKTWTDMGYEHDVESLYDEGKRAREWMKLEKK